MTPTLLVVFVAAAGLLGAFLGYYLRVLVALGKKGSIELRIKEMMLGAKEEAKAIVETAKKEADTYEEKAKKDLVEREEKVSKLENRLIEKEETVDEQKKQVEHDAEAIKQKIGEIKAIKERADQLLIDRQKELERVASMNKEEAREQIIKKVQEENTEDLLVRIQKLDQGTSTAVEEKAQAILTTTVQRLATSVHSDLMSTTVTIPSDEVKGKIIGKEGRNIKTFERITGVEVVVDETPNIITISSFNPLRRHVAKMTLDKLIADGRIQPAKIEEMFEKSKEELNKTIKEKGEQAVFECGIFNFDPKLVSIVGRLHFRTSYGQNVLQHSIEVSHLAGMLAEELGANVQVAKTAGLIHDIGKALDHEVQGSHVEIGRRILQKFGVSEDIIKAMQAHHGEYPYETLEAVIVQTADKLSGSRPGARKDSMEMYLQRLGDLENIATSVPGVEKCYALSAGREIRVFVEPSKVNDIEARDIGRTIAKKIEQELKYPGEIKVTVIREQRIIEYAR